MGQQHIGRSHKRQMFESILKQYQKVLFVFSEITLNYFVPNPNTVVFVNKLNQTMKFPQL